MALEVDTEPRRIGTLRAGKPLIGLADTLEGLIHLCRMVA